MSKKTVFVKQTKFRLFDKNYVIFKVFGKQKKLCTYNNRSTQKKNKFHNNENFRETN